MNFKDAYYMMLQGKKIKRPCRDGREITDGDNLDLTLKNVLAEDWEVLE